MSELAVSGTRRAMREMADGTIRVQIDIDPEFRKAFMTEFNEIDTRVALALLKTEGQKKREQEGAGKFAQALHKSGFFMAPPVLNCLGTDVQFLRWIKDQSKSATGFYGGPDDQIVPAHVRRVANGSGTGIKPPFSAIPLLASEHHEQHQSGESAVASREQFDKWRVKYVSEWAKQQIYRIFEVESLTELDQVEFCRWAEASNLINLIPTAWRKLS